MANTAGVVSPLPIHGKTTMFGANQIGSPGADSQGFGWAGSGQEFQGESHVGRYRRSQAQRDGKPSGLLRQDQQEGHGAAVGGAPRRRHQGAEVEVRAER